MTTSISEIRKDFPLLMSNDVIYLDTAATSQKPSCVLEAERTFYEKYNANPLRGLYELGEAATEKYEEARETVREFLNAREAAEIVFVRNATEGLNLVAYSLSSLVLKPGDEILVSIMEHHSNLLPWQQAAARTGAVVKYLECTEDGKYTEEAFRAALSDRTKIVAMTQVSNVLGCKNDIKHFAQIARCLFCSGRSPERSPYGSGCTGSGCGFFGIFRTQDVCSHGNWCVICEERTVGADASFPVRRGNDRFRQPYRSRVGGSAT